MIILIILNTILILFLFKIWWDYRKLLKDHIKATNDFAKQQIAYNDFMSEWSDKTAKRFNKYSDTFDYSISQDMSVDSYINVIAERRTQEEFKKRIDKLEDICQKDFNYGIERNAVNYNSAEIRKTIKEEIVIELIKKIVDKSLDDNPTNS